MRRYHFKIIPANVELVESINRYAKEVLKEEGHISDELTRILFELENAMWDEISKTKKVRTETDGITKKDGIFRRNILTKNVEVKWRVIYYDNMRLRTERPALDKFSYRKNVEKNFYQLNVTVEDVKGVMDLASFFEGFRHELGHLFFDSNKKFKEDPSINNLNRFARDLIENEEQNRYKQCIGLILYASFKTEQEAYYNGAYEYMMRSIDPLTPEIGLFETQMYGLYSQLNLAVKKISEVGQDKWEQHPFARNTLLILKNNYGISYKRLVQIGNETLEKFKKDFGGLLAKVTRDIRRKYNINATFSKRSF